MAEPKRAFVTGSSGFIGKHLVSLLLSHGYFVTGYDRKEGDDILDFPRLLHTMKGADVVVHLAAEKSVPKSWEDYKLFYHVNILGTHNVLLASELNEVKKVIVISSSATKDQISPYGISKGAAERIATSFSIHGLNVSILRLFNVFGPGQPADDPYSAVVPKFTTAFLNGKRPVIHGDGKQSRDFTYVEDVCEAIYAVANSTFSSSLYEIGYGTSTKVIDLARKIACILNIENPEFFYSERKKGDLQFSKADLGVQIGVKWDKIGLDEGLRRTIEWYKNELSLSHRD